MPRIEIIPNGWETSKEKAQGNGTPTIDVCWRCACIFTEGKPVGEIDLGRYALKGFDKKDIIGSTDVDHPDYDEDTYHCHCCERKLGIKD